MTAEEKRIVYEKYLAGESIGSIAKEMHYCETTISRNLPAGITRTGRNPKNIIYPGLEKWMIANGVTIRELSEKSLGNKTPTPHLSMILHGDISPRKTTIDKILAATGLTYEEAFGTVKDDVGG